MVGPRGAVALGAWTHALGIAKANGGTRRKLLLEQPTAKRLARDADNPTAINE